MKLDFEKFLNDNGLKIGDKVKLSNGKVYEVCRGEDKILSLRKEDGDYVLSLLDIYDFEKIEPKKKLGELKCEDIKCVECPLDCLNCSTRFNTEYTLKERFRTALLVYPELELMRTYFEKQLDKEVK